MPPRKGRDDDRLHGAAAVRPHGRRTRRQVSDAADMDLGHCAAFGSDACDRGLVQHDKRAQRIEQGVPIELTATIEQRHANVGLVGGLDDQALRRARLGRRPTDGQARTRRHHGPRRLGDPDQRLAGRGAGQRQGHGTIGARSRRPQQEGRCGDLRSLRDARLRIEPRVQPESKRRLAHHRRIRPGAGLDQQPPGSDHAAGDQHAGRHVQVDRGLPARRCVEGRGLQHDVGPGDDLRIQRQFDRFGTHFQCSGLQIEITQGDAVPPAATVDDQTRPGQLHHGAQHRTARRLQRQEGGAEIFEGLDPDVLVALSQLERDLARLLACHQRDAGVVLAKFQVHPVAEPETGD